MFTQDNRTESFLAQMGVQYRYTNDLKLSALPPSWDMANYGRPMALRESAIADYAALMESGSAAPAVIVYYDGTDLKILDGLQRIAAAVLSDFSRFSAYIVESDSDDMLACIRVLANVRLQGHAESPEWTKRNAVQHLIIQRGMTATEVAKMGGWKPSDIERLAKVLTWGFDIRCIGGPEKLPDGMVDQISGLTTQENLRRAKHPVAAFLNAIDKCKFSTSDAAPYIEEFFCPVSDRTAERAYLARLEKFMDQPEVDVRIHGRASPGLSRDVNLRRVLKTSISVLDQILNEGHGLRNVDEFFGLVRKIEDRLRRLAPHCQVTQGVPTPSDKWSDHE